MRTPFAPQTTISPFLHVTQLAAFGVKPRRIFADDDDGVHTLFCDLDPCAAGAHKGSMIGRRIEIIGRDAVLGRGLQRRIGELGLVAAQLDQLFERLVEDLPGGRHHPHLQLRELVVGAPELEVDHFVDRAALDHAIHDVRQYLRIYQVTFGFYYFNVVHRLNSVGADLCVGPRIGYTDDAGADTGGLPLH
jgi:hypothetical protein